MIFQMPFGKKKVYNFGDALKFPGKYSKNNKDGTMLTKTKWKEKEARKWVQGVKESGEFEHDFFSLRVKYLRSWLNRTFTDVSQTEAKKILVQLEAEDVQDEQQTEVDNGDENESNNDDITEESDGEMEVGYDSPDMFEGMDVVEEIERKDKRHEEWEKEEDIKRFLRMSDKELMKSCPPGYVTKDKRYAERQKHFVKEYLDTEFENSQEILNQMTQLPKSVQGHSLLNERLSHLSKMEKSNKRVVKNIRESLSLLREDKSHKNFNKRVEIVACLIDPRYGAPDIGETQTVIEAAKKLKGQFLSGEKTCLEVDENKKHEFYPPTVFEIAEESWYNRATTPDPAKHARPPATYKDGGETIPTLYQVVTDDEAYDQFVDHDREKVRVEMQKSCELVREKYRTKEDSETKQKILNMLERKENMFPSKSWFLARKPPQTKMLDDHSTALCRDCISSDINYEAIYKICKKFCKCGLSSCPNWVCMCEDEDRSRCTCLHNCSCVDCSMCKVRNKINKKWIILIKYLIFNTLHIPGYFQNNLSHLKFNILRDFANSVFTGA